MRAARGVVPEWTIGDRLEKARRHADLSVEEIAEEIGVTRNTIGNYTSGRSRPTLATVRVWAQVTGVDFDWLWGDGPEEWINADAADAKLLVKE